MGRQFIDFDDHCVGFGWQIRKWTHGPKYSKYEIYPAGSIPWSLDKTNGKRIYDYFDVAAYKTFDSLKEAKYWCMCNERRPKRTYTD